MKYITFGIASQLLAMMVVFVGPAHSKALVSLQESTRHRFLQIWEETKRPGEIITEMRWQRCMVTSEDDSRDPDGRPYTDLDKLRSCMGGAVSAKPSVIQKKKTPPPQKKARTELGKTQSAGNLTDTANVDPTWAEDTRKRVAKKQDDIVELQVMEARAPYGDLNCPLFMPAPHRGLIDWDWVKVTNRCSYPIAVLACYYDVGKRNDCLPGGKGSFGMLDIKPGETVTSVATSERMPWQVYGLVCNMTPLAHNRMLCVLPDSYKKN